MRTIHGAAADRPPLRADHPHARGRGELLELRTTDPERFARAMAVGNAAGDWRAACRAAGITPGPRSILSLPRPVFVSPRLHRRLPRQRLGARSSGDGDDPASDPGNTTARVPARADRHTITNTQSGGSVSAAADVAKRLGRATAALGRWVAL